MHLTRQAVEITVSAKKKPNSPAIKAPKKLVAAKVIPIKMLENSTVPSTPASNAPTAEQMQPPKALFLKRDTAISEMASKPNATPKTTHKNVGATVTVAVITKKPVTIPTIMLENMAKPTQLFLQLQPKNNILFTPIIYIFAHLKTS